MMRWTVAISASRGAAAPSRHRRDSCPSDEVVAGFFFEFEAIRTEPRCSAQVANATTMRMRLMLCVSLEVFRRRPGRRVEVRSESSTSPVLVSRKSRRGCRWLENATARSPGRRRLRPPRLSDSPRPRVVVRLHNIVECWVCVLICHHVLPNSQAGSS